MKEELSEHTYKISDEQALKHLKILMEFTNPKQLRKSVQATLFAYLLEQDAEGSDANYTTVVEDYFYLIEFLDKLEG